MAKKGKKPAKRSKKKPDTLPRKILRGTMMTCLTLFLIGVVTALIVGGYFFINVMATVTGDPVVNLENEKQAQSQTTIIYAYNDQGEKVEYARLHGEENRIWVDLNQMGKINQKTGMPYIADAYIALEDKRFWDHHGVDWQRLASAMIVYGFEQGGSTITQQLIKNITNEKDVTAIRKYREILAALNLERQPGITKKIIIEAYMNTLYLNRGCYGIKTGAEKYFGKSLDELNLAECASLAAITQTPNKYDPLKNPENNRKRQIMCLDYMLEQELITQAEYDEALAFEMIFTNSENYVPPESAKEEPAAQKEEINNYYVDYIIDTVITDLMAKEGMSKSEATDTVYKGGLQIYAAVDMDIQEQMDKVFRERITFKDLKGTEENPINAAMTVMDYQGRILGIAGGAGEKVRNRGLNRAAATWRQPGSTIKPLSVYGPAIEENVIHWSTLIKNEAFPVRGEMYPRNVDGTFGSGAYVTTQTGLSKSLNTVAARIVYEKLSVAKSYAFVEKNYHFAKLDAFDKDLSPMAVGGMRNGITTIEEAAAYATFGNGGVYYTPFCYHRVLDSRGEELLSKDDKAEQIQVFSEGTAKVMNELLQTVSTSDFVVGGNNKYVGKFKRFGKTGTTNDNKDRWFAGGTPYYVGAVWFGYDTPKDLGRLTNPAGKIWMEVFNRIHNDSSLDSAKTFPKSSKAVQKSYCTATGLLASKNCASATGWYRTNNIPKTCSSCSAAPAADDPVDDAEPTTVPETTTASSQTNWFDNLFGG